MPAAIYTQDIGDDFFPALRAVARDLGADPLHLLKVWYSESGVYATAHNPDGGASGIFQAMPATLRLLGWSDTPAAYRRLSATEQLLYARRYYLPHKGKLATVGAVYVANFLPAFLSRAHDPDFVLTAKGGPLSWAFAANAGLDANGDLAITVRELEIAVDRSVRGVRWAEMADRFVGRIRVTLDLRTTDGIQRALLSLGFGPGAIDGVVGPKTRAAVVSYQKTQALVVDGIVGPRTRGALRSSLAAIGIGAVG